LKFSFSASWSSNNCSKVTCPGMTTIRSDDGLNW
jgi:hypothetical protein